MVRLGRAAYYDPSEPTNPVFSTAYELFWHSVQEVTPEVFEDLYKQVLPTYKVIREFLRDEQYEKEYREAAFENFSQEISNWASRWNLQELPYIFDTIPDCVLFCWTEYPKTVGKYGLYLSVQPFTKYKIFDDFPNDDTPNYDTPNELILPIYHPGMVKESYYKNYIMSIVDKHIEDQNASAEDIGMEPAPLKRTYKHFDWLVIYVVKDLTTREILNNFVDRNKDKDFTESGLIKAISEVAKQIRLPLKEMKRGRPTV